MKKDKEKEKEKKEKLEKKKKEKDEKQEKKDQEKKERQNMTPEEISRIEEMKKGMLRKFSDRDRKRSPQKSLDRPSPTESEVTVDGAAAHSSSVKETRPLTRPQPLPRQQLSSTSSKKEPPPAVMPKPKVKSILKGKGDSVQSYPSSVNLDDSKLLQENTKRNEDLFTEQTSVQKVVPAENTSSVPNEEYKASEDESKPKPFESKLKLPAIIAPKPARIREIEMHRMPSGGFGFSLRKGLIPEHGGGPPRVVTFAEPGSGPSNTQTGLIPGDKLVSVSFQCSDITCTCCPC